MPPRAARLIVPALILVAGFIGIYWYVSPYVALQGVRSAALAREAETFNGYVDYPSVRESLRSQLVVPGGRVGTLVADRLIDALVRPETVMAAMAGGTLDGDGDRGSVAEREGGRNGSGSGPHGDRVTWTIEREGPDRVIVYGAPASSFARAMQRQGFAPRAGGVVFERSGFASWKMTAIVLPADR